ncbi:p87 vp80 [Lasius niger]|uniref:p87 vp80 n=1 Tax=Lasius niger TaxID=67767 RepID=A0A0J7KVC2_LASNI|nr:p87 vp80 [Lasius niger]
MQIENLNVNDVMTPHTVVPIVGDGECLFRALSYVMYGNKNLGREVREQIVDHVVENWDEFSIMSHDSDGNNYASADAYFDDMSRPYTYGGLCELTTAGQLFKLAFEVYRNGELYAKFGNKNNPVERLRSTQNLSSGHFDAYLPYEPDGVSNSLPYEPDGVSNSNTFPTQSSVITHCSQESPLSIFTPKTSRKRHARYTDATRQKQVRTAAKNYTQRNPEVHRSAVTVYQQKNSNIHKAASATYQKNKPEVHRMAVARYEQNNPGKRVERRTILWKVKAYSGLAYDPNMSYENDNTVALGAMCHKCNYCSALKWREEAPGMCCSAGKVQLPPLEPLPESLYSLLMNNHPEHTHFMNRIRKYNGCFQIVDVIRCKTDYRRRFYANVQGAKSATRRSRRIPDRQGKCSRSDRGTGSRSGTRVKCADGDGDAGCRSGART